MDSLDSVELIIAIEKTFDVDILDAEVNTLTTPRLVSDWLMERVSQQEPNQEAVGLLRKIATRDNRPELIPRSGRCWNRTQISAVLREVITECTGATSFSEDSSFMEDIYS